MSNISPTAIDIINEDEPESELSALEFSSRVYEMRRVENCTLIEAVADLVETYDIDVGEVKSLLTPKLLVDITEEAESSGNLKKDASANSIAFVDEEG